MFRYDTKHVWAVNLVSFERTLKIILHQKVTLRLSTKAKCILKCNKLNTNWKRPAAVQKKITIPLACVINKFLQVWKWEVFRNYVIFMKLTEVSR